MRSESLDLFETGSRYYGHSNFDPIDATIEISCFEDVLHLMPMKRNSLPPVDAFKIIKCGLNYSGSRNTNEGI
jgi:hypothetical protein